jgi:PleD family two-component response regulator
LFFTIKIDKDLSLATFHNQYEPITALVIDVNSNMRQIIASMLRSIGFKNIFVATNEVQANDIMATESIALIISGWAPGKLDGLRILERVRQAKKTMSIPFLMVTDLIDQDMVRQAVLNGVSEYIVPPFNKMILQKRLDRALKIPIHSSAANVIKQDSSQRFRKKESTKDLNILIVDDVPDNIEIIRGILKPHYRIRALTSGKSVMKVCLSNQPPDIILLDIMMPEVDGLEVCRQLKQNPMTQNIVVIFLTALSEADDIVRGLELGAVDYITKPIQPSVVLARVNTHSKLVINQRTIQSQIDSLISENTQRDKLDTLLQKKLVDLSKISVENMDYLCNKLKGTSVVDRAFDQLKYCVSMNEIKLLNFNTLNKLENQSYRLNRSRKETSNFIKRLIQLFNFEFREKNLEIKLHLDCDVALFTDENLATYLLCELLDNAIKFSPRGSQVHIKSQELDQHILISIQNVGEIDSDIQETFLDLFVAKGKESGSGIGTYAVILAMKALHGEFYYHSSDQYGTIFYLKFRK